LLRELCDDLINDYVVNKRRSLQKAKRSVRHLLDFFKDARAADLTTDKIRAFIKKRQAEGLSNAEINRELAALKRALNLVLQAQKIYHKPFIPMLKANNIRRGFFEYPQFIAVREALPEHLRPVVTFAFLTAWRKEEVLSLQWHQVDPEEGLIRIEPGITKGEEGRQIFLNRELRFVLKTQWTNRRADCPYVFHRAGRPMKGFRRSWERAVRETSLTGKLFHDFRRTGVRNMIRSMVPERVAMAISGHKTRSVFDRYHIVSDTDLREAARRIDARYRARTVTKTVTFAPFHRRQGASAAL
jgi:integrase